MEMELRKELKAYLFASPGDYCFYIVLFIISIFCLCTIVSDAVSNFAGVLYVLALPNLPVALNILNFKKTIKKYESANQMDMVLADFRTGKFLCDDALCLGENVMIGRYTCNIISYDEIDRVYQYVKRENFAIAERELRVRLTNNRVKTLCRLKKKGENQAEMRLAIEIMKQKNPCIKVGYK